MDSPRQHQQCRCQQDCRNKKLPIPAINWRLPTVDRCALAQIIERMKNSYDDQHSHACEQQRAEQLQRQLELMIRQQTARYLKINIRIHTSSI